MTDKRNKWEIKRGGEVAGVMRLGGGDGSEAVR